MAKREGGLPELLAPAGTLECVYAAVEAGADAIYVGGEAFSARAFAGNLSREELALAVTYTHGYGVKLYVAVNTLLYGKEIDEALAFVGYLYQIGVDGVIVADMGLAAAIARCYPRLPLHASTQMSVHDSAGATALGRLGFSRVVPARELSAENIAVLVEESPLEIEVFLHGALCVCHSGQCLFSSLVGGRSGNRGACAQPCRLPYREGYALSLKDLCLAAHIPALISLGVASLKIEGRMKSPAYVYGVTQIYRRLLDEGRSATPSEMDTLAALFSRSGFTDGYFTGRMQKGMLGVRTQEDKDKTGALGEKHFSPIPLPLEGEAVLREGEPARLTLSLGAHTVTVEGEAPVPAKGAAMQAADVAARLMKLGGTPFSLAKDSLHLELEEGLFLPVSALNSLRRGAVEALSLRLRTGGEAREAGLALPTPEEIAAGVPRLIFGASLPIAADKGLRTALFYRAEVADKADTAYFDLVFLPLWRYFDAKKPPLGVALPPVLPDSEREAARAALQKAYAQGARVALCGGLGTALLAAECGFAVLGDFRLNITNRYSAAALAALGFSSFLLSPELSAEGIRDVGQGGAVVYGRIPLMITERCFTKENGGCAACDKAALHDRMGVAFPMMREAGHRTLIFNSLPTYMGDKGALLSRLGLETAHFIFSVESAEEVAAVIRATKTGASLPKVRRFPK